MYSSQTLKYVGGVIPASLFWQGRSRSRNDTYNRLKSHVSHACGTHTIQKAQAPAPLICTQRYPHKALSSRATYLHTEIAPYVCPTPTCTLQICPLSPSWPLAVWRQIFGRDRASGPPNRDFPSLFTSLLSTSGLTRPFLFATWRWIVSPPGATSSMLRVTMGMAPESNSLGWRCVRPAST